ncbi:hypothetical protein BCR43DRAFT_481261 [Syncephalastrum racemosum]|uniref:Uncharacterized protein n=1 Tax=Syncephalastrum racemosum TaxID=13706 RepID=A0A1X2HRQ0_SYNRA|nr:hypothetical protein BCR43DRAFT_481261 [Syncephalastrum racemosum]
MEFWKLIFQPWTVLRDESSVIRAAMVRVRRRQYPESLYHSHLVLYLAQASLALQVGGAQIRNKAFVDELTTADEATSTTSYATYLF